MCVAREIEKALDDRGRDRTGGGEVGRQRIVHQVEARGLRPQAREGGIGRRRRFGQGVDEGDAGGAWVPLARNANQRKLQAARQRDKPGLVDDRHGLDSGRAGIGVTGSRRSRPINSMGSSVAVLSLCEIISVASAARVTGAQYWR
jgi:hypothetical protein